MDNSQIDLKPNTEGKNEGTQDNANQNFFLADGVEKGIQKPIEQRFDVLLKERGIKWAEAYNEIGLNKSYASKIRRGLIIPPLWMRIKIAQFFKVDTSVIWREAELISAFEMQKKSEEKSNNG